MNSRIARPWTPITLKSWRKAERERLIAAREALARGRPRRAGVVGSTPSSSARSPACADGRLAFCWPIRNEYDARHLARTLRERGALTALPVVVAPKTPLVFREWHPGVDARQGPARHPLPGRLARGRARRGAAADERLGRAGLSPRLRRRLLRPHAGRACQAKPLVIGVTYELARMETIHPQPWDIPMDYVVTERGVYRRDAGKRSCSSASPKWRDERAWPRRCATPTRTTSVRPGRAGRQGCASRRRTDSRACRGSAGTPPSPAAAPGCPPAPGRSRRRGCGSGRG